MSTPFQALSEYYLARLRENPLTSWRAHKLGEIAPEGWFPRQISVFLNIGDDGSVQSIEPGTVTESDRFKTVYVRFPMPVDFGRSSNIQPIFLADFPEYMMGVKTKKPGGKDRTAEQFAAASALHHKVLDTVDSKPAKAILNYFDTWKPECLDTKAFAQAKELVLDKKGQNVTFKYKGKVVTEYAEIREAWEKYFYAFGGSDEPVWGTDMITGEKDIILKKHIRVNIPGGGKPMCLCSFNSDTLDSYGNVEVENAPMGLKTIFRYTAAINYAWLERRFTCIEDGPRIFAWTEKQDKASVSFGSGLCGLLSLNGTINVVKEESKPNGLSQDDLNAIMKNWSRGLAPEKMPNVDMNQKFYIIGLQTNEARIMISFFYERSFGTLLTTLQRHNELFGLMSSGMHFTPWQILLETAKDRNSDNMDYQLLKDVTSSLLAGQHYPARLLDSTMTRIEGDRVLSHNKYSILRAVTIDRGWASKEVKGTELDASSTNAAYTVGRALAVLESVYACAKASQGHDRKDKAEEFHQRYLVSVVRNPKQLQELVDRSQYYFDQIGRDGYSMQYRKALSDIKKILDSAPVPTAFRLPERVTAYAGYRHQRNAFFSTTADKTA